MPGKVQKYGVMTLLMLVFIIDDVLIYALLKELFEWRVTVEAFVIGATVVVLLNYGLAKVVYDLMQKRPTTGSEGMVGKHGVVLKSGRGKTRVRVDGEIWRAESEDRIQKGERVVVEDMRGLTLVVRRSD